MGDVMTYLVHRGTPKDPGEIVSIVLKKLREAKNNTPDHGRDPLIVIAHSMGGNIVYDILTSYAPDLKIDYTGRSCRLRKLPTPSAAYSPSRTAVVRPESEWRLEARVVTADGAARWVLRSKSRTVSYLGWTRMKRTPASRPSFLFFADRCVRTDPDTTYRLMRRVTVYDRRRRVVASTPWVQLQLLAPLPPKLG